VRFLLDQNQSPALTSLLTDEGHDAVHVRELGLEAATDDEILAHARGDDQVIVSADTDFGALLARHNAAGPSVILIRRQQGRSAQAIAALITANLPAIADDLRTGAIVVLEEDRIRIRNLPIQPGA
jgi:predicted nuclease of predicted toxin-antitoxin system